MASQEKEDCIREVGMRTSEERLARWFPPVRMWKFGAMLFLMPLIPIVPMHSFLFLLACMVILAEKTIERYIQAYTSIIFESISFQNVLAMEIL